MSNRKKAVSSSATSTVSAPQPYLNYSLAFVFAILIVMIGIALISGDDDIFWHLATGKWIVQHHAVPATDVFGVITQSHIWIPFEWGWDVVIYFLYSLMGTFTGVQVLPIIIWLVMFGMLASIMRKAGSTISVILVILLLTLFATVDRMTPRPQVITMLGLSTILWLYIPMRMNGSSSTKRIWLLPVLFLVWVNFHLGVVAGFLLLFVILVSEIVRLIIRRTMRGGNAMPNSKPIVLQLCAVLFVCCVVIVINPHGIETFRYAYSHIQMKLLEVIPEWKSPFSDSLAAGGVLWSYKILLVLGFVSIPYSIRHRDFLPAFIYIAFAIYSLQAVRFIGDYAIVTSFGTVLGLDELLGKYSKPIMRFMKGKGMSYMMLVILTVMVLMIPTDSLYTRLKISRHFGLGIDRNFFPMSLMAFIKEHDIHGNPFNTLGMGGLLIWNQPEEKSFIDTRNLGDDIGKEYYSILTKQPGFAQKLDSYHIDYICMDIKGLIQIPSMMAQSLISYCSTDTLQWRLVFWDDGSFLFVRNEPDFKKVIEDHEYRILNPYLYMYKRMEFDSLRRAEPQVFQKEFERKISEEPDGQIMRFITRYIQQPTK